MLGFYACSYVHKSAFSYEMTRIKDELEVLFLKRVDKGTCFLVALIQTKVKLMKLLLFSVDCNERSSRY